MSAEFRYTTIEGERTELFVVGSVTPEEAGSVEDAQLIVALPFAAEHTGQWAAFVVETIAGAPVQMRMTRIPYSSRAGLRKHEHRISASAAIISASLYSFRVRSWTR